MRFRLTLNVIVALLSAGTTVLPAAIVRADEPVTIGDMQAAIAKAREIRRANSGLSLDAAFRPAPLDSARAFPSLPMLQIPAATEVPQPNTASAPENPYVASAQRSHRAASSTKLGNPSLASARHLEEAPLNALERLPRLLFTTLLVLAGCAGSLLSAHRWLKRSGRIVDSPAPRRLQIVATLTLPSRSQLHVIKFDDREVLVGVDARGLRKVEILAPTFEAVLQRSQHPESSGIETEELRSFRNVDGTGRSLAAA